MKAEFGFYSNTMPPPASVAATRESLWSLLSTHGFTIRIPLLHREYAHGRPDAETTRIRRKLLDDLSDALREAASDSNGVCCGMDLGFLYGNLTDDRVFVPVDGQQRLITLFLLYWLLHRETKITQNSLSPLEKVIARCAFFDPDNRFSDVGQVKRALLAARPEARKKQTRLWALAACLFLALAALGAGLIAHHRQQPVSFSEPLIEQAVRANLGLSDTAPITKDMLEQVTALYIVADAAYPDADSFYPAINRWYAEGKPTRGAITDLNDLAAMPNLERVCIVAQELTDISALAELPKLDKVELKHNYLTDISVLAGMDHLTYVGINDNPVRDISPLAACPNLAFLDLCDVRSYEPSVIAQLGNFNSLDISNPTGSYRYLDGKSILDLRLAWSGLDDLHCLDHVTRLERLEIDHTAVSDLSPLALHKGLKVLKLAGLPVTDLSVLLELPQLEEVYISEELRPAAEALGPVPFSFVYE